MLTTSALALHIEPTVFGVTQIGDAVVHECVYLLHASLGTVIVEVGPTHACDSGATRYGGTELVADGRCADHGTKMLGIKVPFRLHVLDFIAIRQYHLVKFCSIEYGEMQRGSIFGDVLNNVHSRLELTG